MFERLIIFVKYHNVLPLVVLILFLGFGGAMAANPELRENAVAAVISSSQTIIKIDNSLILSVNFDQFKPSAQITNIKEDGDNYYVSYTLYTIDLQNGAWSTVSQGKNITVSKRFLDNKDLGLYIAKQIKEVTDRQLEYLKEVQGIERGNGITQKTVTIKYSGLIGKYLDPKEEVIIGYQPVIPPEIRPKFDTNHQITNTSLPATSIINTTNNNGDTIPPTITILGNNPASIEIRKAYSDNGATVTDNSDINLGVSIILDGVAVSEIQIDTSVEGEHTIIYTATDSDGNSTSATRIVIVEDTNKPIKQPLEEIATTTAEIIPEIKTGTSTETIIVEVEASAASSTETSE